MHDLADLKHAGLKATLPRIRILRLFRESAQRHLSAEDVYKMLLLDDADLGMATVYRVLAQFEQTGLLRRNQLGSNRAVYELTENRDRHGHLVCNRTQAVHEFFDQEIDERLKSIAAGMGFDMTDYVITVFGSGTQAPLQHRQNTRQAADGRSAYKAATNGYRMA